MSGRSLLALAAGLALALAPRTAPAQFLTRPHLDWRTVETTHFRIHYPRSLEPWTRTFAERVEAVHTAVTAAVGSAPDARIDVVIDDPYNIANGMAIASITAPVLYLWPTPPEPGLTLGAHRGWSELLAVHEYAHLAHLTRPSRNRGQRLLWRLLPENVGPIARRAPRWVSEGYATYLEGQLTGSGRPFGVFRPAVLRQFAVEGRLPAYGELDDSRAFLGGAMAYLAGSAYLEWLVRRSGEQSLRDLWSRMTARNDRSFVEAFRGVFGDEPEDLYRRFTVEVTGEALRIERELRETGLAEGETIRQRDWAMGAPAVSPDGEHVALSLPGRLRPGRLVVMETAPADVPARVTRARERALERDPEDVPAIDTGPRPRRIVATLHAFDGRVHVEPRFLPHGESVLVTRSEPLADGTLRPDLFVWHWREGGVRRVTHGAGIRTPDPSPDGREAVATQCTGGACSVVIVNLATGAVTTIAEGTPFRSWSKPRFSPDGRRIAAAVQNRGPWRLAVIDRVSGAVTYVPRPDSANRYDAAFTAAGDALVAVSEAGGIPNIVRIDPQSGTEQSLTRVLGAAAAPAPATDGRIYFLRLHARGLDLAWVHVDSAVATPVALDPGRFPAAPVLPEAPADTFAIAPLAPSTSYGLGPRQHRLLPAASGGGDWLNVGATLIGTDPVGRLSWTLQGVYADDGGWRGAALGAEYRRWRPWLTLEAFHVRHDPSRHEESLLSTRALDAEYSAGTLSARLVRQLGWRRERYRVGGSGGRLALQDASEPSTRTLGFAELELVARAFAPTTLEASVSAHASAGSTMHAAWTRAIGTAALEARHEDLGIRAEGTAGRVSSDAPSFEQFLLGGEPPPLMDAAIMSQRVAIPALPFASRGGDRFVVARGSLTGGGFEPYYLLANVGDLSGRWNRVIGVEQDVETDAIPLARLPAVRAVAGAGYSLDAPARKTWRLYFFASVRP